MSNNLKILKSETQPLHDHLESISHADKLMSGELSLLEYQSLVYRNFLIFSSLEPLINDFVQQKTAGSLSQFSSQRLPDLQKDLALFSTTKQPNNSILYPKFIHKDWTIGHFIGVLYVVEGSRLGGKVIVKALRKNQALNNLTDFCFYAQHGVDVRQRWLDFMRVANEKLVDDTFLLQAIQAAKQTFQYFIEVFEKDNLSNSF